MATRLESADEREFSSFFKWDVLQLGIQQTYDLGKFLARRYKGVVLPEQFNKSRVRSEKQRLCRF